jgi:hypothetical protein
VVVDQNGQVHVLEVQEQPIKDLLEDLHLEYPQFHQAVVVEQVPQGPTDLEA